MCTRFPDGGCSSVVESRIVIPVVVGSIPISHPNKTKIWKYQVFFYASYFRECNRFVTRLYKLLVQTSALFPDK